MVAKFAETVATSLSGQSYILVFIFLLVKIVIFSNVILAALIPVFHPNLLPLTIISYLLSLKGWIFLAPQEIMCFLTSTAIYIMLAWCTTYTFLMLISGLFAPIITLVNKAVLLISDVLTWAIFCIFLICANGNLTLSSFLMV